MIFSLYTHSGAEGGGSGGGSDDEGEDDDEPDNGSSSSRRPCRIVERDAGKGLVRVHWLRYPESYDEWRGVGEAPPGARPLGEEVRA